MSVTLASLGRSGMIEDIIAEMKTHPNLAKQESACKTLAVLALNDDNKVVIARSGGIAALLTAMDTHPNDTWLLSQASRALGNLAVNANNKVVIARSGGIAAVQKAMNTHPNNADVQEWCPQALEKMRS